MYRLSFSASRMRSIWSVMLLSTESDDDELVFQDVAADPEHAETVGQRPAGLFDRQVRRLEAQLLVAFEARGDETALVDHGDPLFVAARELHDERRGGHQPDHQYGHQQGGDDEGFFTDALVEFASYDDTYL